MNAANVVSLIPRIRAKEEAMIRKSVAANVVAARRIKAEVVRRLLCARAESKLNRKRFAYPTLQSRNVKKIAPGEMLIMSLPSRFTRTGSPFRQFALDMCRQHYDELKAALQADLVTGQAIMDYVNEQGSIASLVSTVDITVYLNRLLWLADELEACKTIPENSAKDFCES